MILFPLVFVLAIALTIWFVFVTEASVPAKVLVGALFIASLLLRYAGYSMAGFFLQIALNIFVLIYQRIQMQ